MACEASRARAPPREWPVAVSAVLVLWGVSANLSVTFCFIILWHNGRQDGRFHSLLQVHHRLKDARDLREAEIIQAPERLLPLRRDKY